MSSPTPLTGTPVTTQLSASQEERRQMRRAGVSLLVRLRSTDCSGDQFEEVRTTLNATRKAIYFFTTLDRYRKGMRLRVMSPYNPEAGEGNLEQVGEVVRVQRRNEGYGVAVALLTPAPLPQVKATGATSELSTLENTGRSQRERRIASRLLFVAPVEVVDMHTGSRVQARTSDLSMQGCYIDTLNPSPLDSAVRVQIQRDQQILDVLATVTARHLGSGMGLVFADMTPAQREVVTNWLTERKPLPPVLFGGAVPPSLQPRRGDRDALYAIRLIHALVHKGLLSQSEANEILSEPDA